MTLEVLFWGALNCLFDAGASLTHLLDASHRVGSRSAELKQGLALRSLNRLLPRILVANWAVLELLAADGYFLIVLLAICPILLEMYAVAACTLDGLHG